MCPSSHPRLPRAPRMTTTTLPRCSRFMRCCVSLSTVGCFVLIAGGCQDATTLPQSAPLAAGQAPRRSLDAPSSVAAELVARSEAPLAGNERDLARYETPTVVAMTVHQDFAI